jgi:hypothetical protein
MDNWRINTKPSDLTEGLFGQIVLHVFEVLPTLYYKQIFPDWQITSMKYGVKPNFTVIPGIFNLTYEVKQQATDDINLKYLRENLGYIRVLGNQWGELNSIWNAYFKIPSRTVKLASEFGNLSHALGLHYRGTDKNQDFRQTNPVGYDDFITLVKNYICNHEDIDTIFIASDDDPIKKLIKEHFKQFRILDTGKVNFWNTLERSENYTKGDQAVLDCLLLSKCKFLIKNQSALSGFAKILNPNLDAHRIAASKLFNDIPYFPDAYIPPLESEDSTCKNILNRLLKNDWTQNKKAFQKFGTPFVSMERKKPTKLKTIYNNSHFFWFRKYVHDHLLKKDFKSIN